ncbi:hypothetical protein [Myceligenerans cantabricum]
MITWHRRGDGLTRQAVTPAVPSSGECAVVVLSAVVRATPTAAGSFAAGPP